MYNTLIRVLAVALLLLTSMLPACACGAAGGGGGGIVCTGGARMVGSGCYCPTGTTFDGAQCQGQAQQGNCPAGEFEVVGAAGPSCFCPDNYVWVDANKNSCSACAGGSVPNGDYACACPNGMAWDGNACAQQQQQVAEQPQCNGGAIMTDNGCQCPDGFGWDGNQCSQLQQGAPVEQQQVIQQQTIHRSANISLTCCINHAQYTCPSQDAFNACVTLNPSQCTRAGGC